MSTPTAMIPPVQLVAEYRFGIVHALSCVVEDGIGVADDVQLVRSLRALTVLRQIATGSGNIELRGHSARVVHHACEVALQPQTGHRARVVAVGAELQIADVHARIGDAIRSGEPQLLGRPSLASGLDPTSGAGCREPLVSTSGVGIDDRPEPLDAGPCVGTDRAGHKWCGAYHRPGNRCPANRTRSCGADCALLYGAQHCPNCGRVVRHDGSIEAGTELRPCPPGCRERSHLLTGHPAD